MCIILSLEGFKQKTLNTFTKEFVYIVFYIHPNLLVKPQNLSILSPNH